MRQKFLIGIIALMSLALLGCPNPQSPSLIVFNDGATVSRTLPISTYTNTVKFIGDGAISYTSSAPAVAQVGASNGVVTIFGVGQTTITANMAATVTYKASSAAYTLTITGYTSTIVFADGAAVTKYVGGGAYTNAVSGDGAGVLSYVSSAPAIATVDAASGAVTPLAAGQTVITAAKAATATHGAVSAAYTLTVALNASAITFADGAAVTRSAGSGAYTNAVSGTGTGAVSYSSSVPAVATVDAASGAVSPLAEGQTVITATKAATATHNSVTASYTLTVGAPLTQSTIVFADGAAVTREFSSATYTNTVSGIGDGALSYSSGTPATATISAGTGAVTFVNLGTTVITASRAATATCTAATASYTLTVSAPTVPLASTIVFYNGTTVSRRLGSGLFTNAISGDGNGNVTYTSGTPATATVNSAGQVTLVATGTTVITASKAATAIYAAATNSYTLTVQAALVTPTFSFANGSSVSKAAGSGAYTNTVTTNSDGAITYSSSNLNVATVVSTTGAVTPLTIGSVVISAYLEATEIYAGLTRTYTMTVTAGLLQSTIVFNDASATFTRATDSGIFWNKVSYTSVGDGAITYTSSVPATATAGSKTGIVVLKTAGSTVITATRAATATYASSTNSFTLEVTTGKTNWAIGDTGPSGVGKVFYVSTDGLHGKEASPLNWYNSSGDPLAQWKTGYLAENASYGGGYLTTYIDLNMPATASQYPAAALCRAYNGGAKSDWYLPSVWDWESMYAKRSSIGGPIEGLKTDVGYWSSTSYTASTSIYWFSISQGIYYSYNPTPEYHVRPIREF